MATAWARRERGLLRGRPMTNHELAALIQAAGRSHAALARKVNTAAAGRHGLDLRYDQASVYWWLRGRVPTDPVPGLLAEILSDWLARVVQVADLGFTDPGGHLGLDLAAAPGQAQAVTASGSKIMEATAVPSAAPAAPAAPVKPASAPAAPASPPNSA